MLTVSLLVCAMIALARADDAVQDAPPEVAHSRCPDGFEEFHDRCFHFVAKERNWADSETNCQSMKANLASVHSAEEYQFIQGVILAKTNGFPHSWIGGTDCQQDGSWLWSNGKVFFYENWCRGEPDNEGGSQCCTEMNFGVGKCWNDIDCSSRLPSVCALNL